MYLSTLHWVFLNLMPVYFHISGKKSAQEFYCPAWVEQLATALFNRRGVLNTDLLHQRRIINAKCSATLWARLNFFIGAKTLPTKKTSDSYSSHHQAPQAASAHLPRIGENQLDHSWCHPPYNPGPLEAHTIETLAELQELLFSAENFLQDTNNLVCLLYSSDSKLLVCIYCMRY